MHKVKPPLILFICISATIILGLSKYYSSEFRYFNSGLSFIILLTVFLKKDVYTYIFGSFTLLIMTAAIFKDESWLNYEGLVSQFLGFTVVVVTIAVVLHIKKLHRCIEEERVQMKVLFEFAAEAIIMCTREGKIQLANPRAQQLFLYEEGEMIGKQIEALLPQSIHLTDSYPDLGPDATSGTYYVPQKKDLVAVGKSGLSIDVEVSLINYTIQKESFVLVFITDISTRKESENLLLNHNEVMEKNNESIKKMNVELENKVSERTLILREALQELERSQSELNEALSKEKDLNELKTRFVSMASHEFRTPLSTVLSSASLLSRYPLTEDQEKREKHIRRIKDSVRHLSELLEDFLKLGKVEDGRVFTKVSHFEVKEFILDIIDEMKSGLKEGQKLNLLYHGEDGFLTDKRLLKNVLINLVSNAIKFSDENQQIIITVHNSGSQLVIQVKDYGIGIPSEDMQHLFSTFYRGRNVVNIQGTGLGLHIVKRYIDMLDGEITLSSTLNEGTTFDISLPRLAKIPVSATVPDQQLVNSA